MSRIEQLLSLQKESPQDSFIAYAIALEYSKTGQKEEAIKALNLLMEEQASYLGTYYQLGKLHEQAGNMDLAKSVYERGMEEAKKAGDQHTLSELMSANTNLGYA